MEKNVLKILFFFLYCVSLEILKIQWNPGI